MRGYNLDHGTDLETYVDGMPINQPTHAHGQGYTDLNFMIPELADAITYTKGPYYADVGDFGAVGSVHVNYRDTIPDQIAATVGTLGFQRHLQLRGRNLWETAICWPPSEVQHYDGPFVTPDDARKENAVLRYSEGDDAERLFSHRHALSPAVDQHHRHSAPRHRRGSGPRSLRHARSHATAAAHGGQAFPSTCTRRWATGQLSASAFFIDNQLHLWNDFTHFLVDPVHGDQEDQFENRRAVGGRADYTLPVPIGIDRNEIWPLASLPATTFCASGACPARITCHCPTQTILPRSPTTIRCICSPAPPMCRRPRTGRRKFRSVLGFRDDYQHGTDVDYLAALHEIGRLSVPMAARPAVAAPAQGQPHLHADSIRWSSM